MEDHSRSIMRFNNHTGQLAKIIPDKIKPPATVLDAGCGSGIHSIEIAKMGYNVTAYDLNIDGMIPDIYNNNKINIFKGSLTNIKFKTSFDVIYCNHVLEHISSPGLVLDQFRSLLKPEGYLFIGVPTHNDTVSPGHLIMGWNIGQLMILLASHGFAVWNGHFKMFSHSIFGIVPVDNNDNHIKLDDISIFNLCYSKYPDDSKYTINGIERVKGKVDQLDWRW